MAPAPRCRDGEVRPRHVLPERRPGGAVRRRGPGARPEPQGRDLRPPAGDERRRRDRRPDRGHRVGRLRLRSSANFANPDMVGHTGAWDATVRAVETVDACIGRIVDGARDRSRPPARSSWSPRTTATRISIREPDGSPVTAHSLNPVPILLAGARRRRPTARRRRPRRRGPDDLRARGPAGLARHDGPIPSRVPSRGHRGGTRTVNPVLAAGQLIVAVALTFAVLLQSRGSGLGGTFGGDSAVYRSRRGIERRLWQFTIVLIVLFSMFSLAGVRPDAGRLTRRSPGSLVHRRRVAPSMKLPRPGRRGCPEHRPRRPVDRRAGAVDRIVRGLRRAHARATADRAATSRACSGERPTRAHSGRAPPRIASLVALLFRGLVRLGPDSTIVGDLATPLGRHRRWRHLDVPPARRPALAGRRAAHGG